MRPTVDLAALKKVKPGEYLLRFAFGGMIAAVTGIIAHAYGPAIGGLFLAFPAILPATLTLVAKHDGRRQAAEDARGAVLGAIALAMFAAVAQALALRCAPVVTLAAASAAWIVAATALWIAYYGRGR